MLCDHNVVEHVLKHCLRYDPAPAPGQGYSNREQAQIAYIKLHKVLGQVCCVERYVTEEQKQ